MLRLQLFQRGELRGPADERTPVPRYLMTIQPYVARWHATPPPPFAAEHMAMPAVLPTDHSPQQSYGDLTQLTAASSASVPLAYAPVQPPTPVRFVPPSPHPQRNSGRWRVQPFNGVNLGN